MDGMQSHDPASCLNLFLGGQYMYRDRVILNRDALATDLFCCLQLLRQTVKEKLQ